MRTVYLFQGNFYGNTRREKRLNAFYAAAFDAWKKSALLSFDTAFQPTLDDAVCYRTGESEDEKEKAERVLAALKKIDGRAPFEIDRILLSGERNRGEIAYLYLKEIFRFRAPSRDKTYLSPVADAVDVCKKISREIERMQGFLRFKEAENGIFYAAGTPDHDVFPLLSGHFIARMQAPFVLHDVSRAYAVCYDGERVGEIEAESANVFLSEREEAFAALWKTYFERVAIRARTNPRAQDTFMPRRYRKFMDETKR